MARNPSTWEGLELASGRYRITDKLGEGGMGFVYKAFDTKRKHNVVIKVPNAMVLQNEGHRKRFEREYLTLRKLSHPNVVKIYEAREARQLGSIPYAVMQYLAGGDLSGRLSNDPTQLREWLPAIASALDYVHQRDHVHRDVKPGNILFDAEGKAYLSDFGIIKIAYDAQNQKTNLTGTGMFIGTPDYMAPEIHDGETVGGPVDQYALAVIVYEALAGKLPFNGKTPIAIAFAHKTERAAQIGGIHPDIEAAIMRGLAKDPAERFPNCSEFAEAVLNAVDNKAPAIQPSQPTAEPTTKNVGLSKTIVDQNRLAPPQRPPPTRPMDRPPFPKLSPLRKSKRKRIRQIFWISSATGFVLLATAIVLLFTSGSDEKTTLSIGKSDSRKGALTATDKAKEKAEAQRRDEAERKDRAEANRKAEAERKTKEEAERKAKEEAERNAKKEAEQKAKEEAARIAKVEAGRTTKVRYWPNGQKRIEAHYKNGELDGLETEWHENGKKKSEHHYKNGVKDGLWTDWSNGQKRMEAHYKDGKKEGLETYWYKGRQKKGDVHYKNGKKKSEHHYKNGKQVGLETWWDKDGKKRVEGTFKNGKPDGLGTYWYEGGQKRMEEHFKDGKYEGLWTGWYENGQKKGDVHYKNGKRDGLETGWYENGQKKREAHYKDGKKEGLETWWHKDGKKKSEYHFVNDERDGPATYWDENGQKRMEEHYKNNKLEGLKTRWDRNGQKQYEIQYKDNKEVSRKEF